MRKLNEYQLALKEDDEFLVLHGRHLLRRVLNQARKDLEDLHLAAQAEGNVARVTADPEKLEAILLAAANELLGPVEDKPKELTA